MTTEFSFTHDDFSLDGLFAICDELLIEIEVNIHGEFSVACVDRMDRGHAFPVPEVVTEYVKIWALTEAGKATIRKAYNDAEHQRCPVSEREAMQADYLRDERRNAA